MLKQKVLAGSLIIIAGLICQAAVKKSDLPEAEKKIMHKLATKKQESIARAKLTPNQKKNQYMKLKAKLKQDLTITEKVLKKHPNSLKRIEKYLRNLKTKSDEACSICWLKYQISRLKQIRWSVDENDNGIKTGMKIRMRPYDIPFIVMYMGYLGTDNYHPEKAQNGIYENINKMLRCPQVEIEFTDKFADFCYLCKYMTTEGCSVHPEFEEYGKSFPPIRQISDELKKDSGLMLDILGLKYTDVISAKRFFTLCVEKASEPSDFPHFPQLKKRSWNSYRAGIEKIKEWRKKFFPEKQIEMSREQTRIVKKDILWKKVKSICFGCSDNISKFKILDGEWEIKDGKLWAVGGDRHRTILLTQSGINPVRIEFDAVLYPDKNGQICDITVLLNTVDKKPYWNGGYALTTGSYRNTCSLFFKKDAGVIARSEYSPLRPNIKYHIMVEFNHGQIAYWVNNRIIMEVKDETPLIMTRSNWIGIRTWGTKMSIDNFVIKGL